MENEENFPFFQDGGTPLFVSCQCGHLDVAKELVNRGANVNAHMKASPSLVLFLFYFIFI